MITGTQARAAVADFKLPEATTKEDPTITGFSTVYKANATQFATREEADALANLLGGQVSDLSEQWSLMRISPLYQVELSNGVSLNAGLLADRFRRYGTEAALEMTEAETGMSLHNLSSAAAPAAEATLSASASVPFLSANAAVVPTPQVATASSSVPAAASPSISDGPTAASDAQDKDAKLSSAARQFEALMLGTILKSATPEDGGGILSGQGDSAGQSIYQMAMENFAQMLSERGGLGLAEQVTTQMRTAHTTTSTVA